MAPKNTSHSQVESLLQLGRSQLELKQWRAAQKSFKKILKLAPENESAQVELARLAQQQHKTRQARQYLARLLEQNPHHSEALSLWALLFGAQEADSTLEKLERALINQPQNAQLSLRAAQCLFSLSQPERARYYLHNAWKQLPQVGELCLELAGLFLQSGELNQAIAAFDRAVELEPALRDDPRWIDLEADWQKLQTHLQADAQFDALMSRTTVKLNAQNE